MIDLAVADTERQAFAPVMIIENFHIKKLILRSAGKQISHRNIRIAQLSGHDATAGNMTVTCALYTVKYFHGNMISRLISAVLTPKHMPIKVSVGKCTPSMMRERPIRNAQPNRNGITSG